MCFSAVSFTKNFLQKPRPRPIYEENGFKEVFQFISFYLIYLFFYLFCHMPNPKILWSVVENQKMRWKNNEQQIVGTQTFPHLNSLTFNYMWFNFQVFISYASSYWSFYYSHFCCLLPPTPLTTEKLEQRCEICSN